MSEETGWRSTRKDFREPSNSAGRRLPGDVPEIYEFGPFRLEPAERKFLRGNEAVALTPKAFDTLYLLVRNSGHLLEKDELIRMLCEPSLRSSVPTRPRSCPWPFECSTDWARSHCGCNSSPGDCGCWWRPMVAQSPRGDAFAIETGKHRIRESGCVRSAAAFHCGAAVR